MSNYYKAAVCLGGHLIQYSLPPDSPYPDEFCETCGKEVISVCPHCGAYIHGRCSGGIPSTAPHAHVPSYCYGCGKPYPWIEAQHRKLKRVIELDESLSETEKTELVEASKDIMTESPTSTLDASLFRGLASRAGNLLKDALYKFAVDVASETAKKIIFPGR